MGRRPNPDRRVELLDAVVDHLVDIGLADVSLRPLAEALGVSTFTLGYHFGDKEELLLAALDRAEERQRSLAREALAAAGPDAGFADACRHFWVLLSAEPALGLLRLVYEASVLAIRHPEAFGEHATRLVSAWITMIEQALLAEGRPRREAASRATATNAVFTGLLIDLLVTGDRPRVQAAADLVLDELAREYAIRTS